MRFSIRSTCNSLARTEEDQSIKALIKYEVKKSRLFKVLTIQAQVRWPTTTPYSSLAACIKVLPVLTSTRVLVKVLGRVLTTRVENYSLAAALVVAAKIDARCTGRITNVTIKYVMYANKSLILTLSLTVTLFSVKLRKNVKKVSSKGDSNPRPIGQQASTLSTQPLRLC